MRESRPWLSLAILWAGFSVLSLPYRTYAVDFKISDYLFLKEGNDWALEHAWVTESLLHEGGRLFSELLALIVIAGLIASITWPALRHWRR